MLYDHKRWDKSGINADPFKLKTLIEWLEKQPASKKYEFTDCAGCALAQYFESYGFGGINMGTEDFDYGEDFEHTIALPIGWNDLVNPNEYPPGWNTFGAALQRARKFA